MVNIHASTLPSARLGTLSATSLTIKDCECTSLGLRVQGVGLRVDDLKRRIKQANELDRIEGFHA